MVNKSYNDLFCLVMLCMAMLIILGCSDESDVQNDRIEGLFRLSDFGQCTIPMDSQGMDVYDDKFLFQGSYVPKQGCCGIVTVDLSNRQLLGEFTFGQDIPLIHMNNINCGKKYDETDKFPLLYLCDSFGTDKCCYVVRVSDDASHYKVVQTITYCGQMMNYNYYQDWILDAEEGIIVAYGKSNSIVTDYGCLVFSLPVLENSIIRLSDDDVLDSFVISAVLIPQGSKLQKGILYTVYGYNNDTYPAWYLEYDKNAKRIIKMIQIDHGVGEPEAVAIFKDKVLINNNSTNPTYWRLNYITEN